MFLEIWESKSNTPYITYCEDNKTPLFSVEYKSIKDREKQLLKEANKGLRIIRGGK